MSHTHDDALSIDHQMTAATFSKTTTSVDLLDSQALLNQRYMLLRPIGRGGFGAVYRAADTKFHNRSVAIKEMSRNGLTPQEYAEALEAFLHEAALLSSLTHPNLPRIYEQFSEQGRSYLVMDFIDGQTLEERLQVLGSSRLSPDKVLDLALQLCAVLDYLHTREPPIIFRDLKPANIMLTETGQVFLIDFGIARLFKPGQHKDTTALGSYGYAPPEQYGKSQTTVRADIYSLGATLHQLLSGDDPSETPFQFSPLSLPEPGLVGLDALVMKMVSVEVSQRPASIVLVRQELQQVMSRYLMGSTLRYSVGPVPVSVGSTTSVGHTYQSSPVTVPRPAKKILSRPVAKPQVYPQPNMIYVCLGHTSRITAVAWSPDGKYLASASYDKMVRIWNARNGQHLFLYKGHNGRVNSIAWSPDSLLLASASDDRTVHIWQPATGQVDYVFRQHTGSVNALAWSPDGRSIASAGSDKTVLVWNKSTHEAWSSFREHEDHVLTLAWSPDGRSIASAGKDSQVRIWDVEQRPRKRFFFTLLFSSHPGQRIWANHGGTVLSLAWSPDGQSLASSSSDHRVRVREMSMLHTTHVLDIDDATSKNTLVWSPSGKHLAIGGNDKAVRIWNFSEEKEIFIYSGHTNYVLSLAWSPDGSKIASAGIDRTIQVWQTS